MSDFGLDRFVRAQEGTWETALAEVTAGRKRSHWIWFVFPQAAGLGRSETSRFFAIGSDEEAAAYLAHPILGPRLVEISRAALLHRGRSAHEIFGSPDDLKLLSCARLFSGVPGADPVFAELLEAFARG